MGEPTMSLRHAHQLVDPDSSSDRQRIENIKTLQRSLLPATENDRLIAQSQIRGGVVPDFR